MKWPWTFAGKFSENYQLRDLLSPLGHSCFDWFTYMTSNSERYIHLEVANGLGRPNPGQ